MIVQLDIDGTIDQAPEFFRWLTIALKRDSHQVLIVTSRSTSNENVRITTEEMRDYGIVFDKLLLSPEVDDLDPRRLPHDLPRAHRLYVSKLIAAQDYGTEVLFDDCSITGDLFRKHAPHVQVFRPIPKR